MKKFFMMLAAILTITTAAYTGEMTKIVQNPSDLYEWLNKATQAINTGTLSNMGVKAATTKIEIGAAGAYKIDGKIYSSTASNTLTFSSGHTALAASQQAIFVISLDTSGAVVTTQSRIVSDTAAAPALVYTSTNAPIAYVNIKTNSGAIFTPNTTAMNASGVTAVFTQFAHEPVSLTIAD